MRFGRDVIVSRTRGRLIIGHIQPVGGLADLAARGQDQEDGQSEKAFHEEFLVRLHFASTVKRSSAKVNTQLRAFRIPSDAVRARAGASAALRLR